MHLFKYWEYLSIICVSFIMLKASFLVCWWWLLSSSGSSSLGLLFEGLCDPEGGRPVFTTFYTLWGMRVDLLFEVALLFIPNCFETLSSMVLKSNWESAGFFLEVLTAVLNLYWSLRFLVGCAKEPSFCLSVITCISCVKSIFISGFYFEVAAWLTTVGSVFRAWFVTLEDPCYVRKTLSCSSRTMIEGS